MKQGYAMEMFNAGDTVELTTNLWVDGAIISSTRSVEIVEEDTGGDDVCLNIGQGLYVYRGNCRLLKRVIENKPEVTMSVNPREFFNLTSYGVFGAWEAVSDEQEFMLFPVGFLDTLVEVEKDIEPFDIALVYSRLCANACSDYREIERVRELV